MDKLKMHSVNKVDEHIKKIAALFPNCVTERKNEDGEVEYAVDFDMLRQELSDVIVEGSEERYQFTWPDKKKSILLANAPIAATLRPCRAESVGRDGTPGGFDSENLYIEGDNLDVLKLLQETYLGKIKMIYIDPPYNTGNDFVYEDDFAESADEYLATSGQFDAEGNRLVQNTESNGRFHTDWLNMIYPRLKLAKDLLSENGVIFISIDDNEVCSLRKICGEVFGESNFVAEIVWQKRTSPDMRTAFSIGHEYVIVYCRNIDNIDKSIFPMPLSDEDKKHFQNPDNDPKGPWVSSDFTAPGFRPNQMYPITTPSGVVVLPPKGRCWKNVIEVYNQLLKEGRLWFGADGKGVPRQKTYLFERNGKVGWTWWPNSEVGHNQEATKELNRLLEFPVFDFPKPTRYIKRMISLASHDEDIILDFFSGSATTAHAVMQLNAEDGGHRKFIMVQLPEETDEKSEAYKAGYKNICEIGKERIRRAGKKIKEEFQIGSGFEQLGLDSAHFHDDIMAAGESAVKQLDIGFRVLKLDSSNMKDVYYSPAEYTPSMFERLADNIKEDRTPEDLLFQVMLDLGILLSSKIAIHNSQCIIHNETREYRYFDVADGFLIACFDTDITDEIITEIAKKKPYYFVTRDHSMASDSVATNFDQIFATYSPDTVRKVL